MAHFRGLARSLDAALPEVVEALVRLRAAIRDTQHATKETV